MSTIQQGKISVSPYEGKTFRFRAYACEGDLLQASDVSSISYTVYKVDLGSLTAVSGHTEVSVPTSSLLASPQTSPHTGNEYNFEHRLSAADSMPFPESGYNYRVVYTFFDTEGDRYTCEIICSCQ